MRIYATAITLACLCTCGVVSTSSANTTSLEIPQHQSEFMGSGSTYIHTPTGNKVNTGTMYVLLQCNDYARNAAVGTVSTAGYSGIMGGTKASTLISGELKGGFASGATLYPKHAVSGTAKWFSYGTAALDLGYNGHGNDSTAVIYANNMQGYTDQCQSGVNLWIGWDNKPAKVCIGGSYCDYQGSVYALVKKLPNIVKASMIGLTYPDTVTLRSGESTKILGVGVSSGKAGPVKLTFSVSSNLKDRLKLTDNTGTPIVLGGTTTVQSDAGYEVHAAAVNDGWIGSTAGEITITGSTV